MPEQPLSSTKEVRLPHTGRVLSPLAFSLFFFIVCCPSAPVSAEVRVIASQGEFRMGDRDTREDAVRLAMEAAKRNALEQVATYLESVTVVEGTDITRDEIRTYTAGLILVLDQQTNLQLDGDTVVVRIDLTSQIDTEEVAQAILALRENESARHQLATLKTEIDDLHKELEAANLSLASALTAEEAHLASVQRQDILDHVQSNAMVSQAWTDWAIAGPVGYPAPWGWLPPQGLLNAARGLYPASRHVEAAQQIIVAMPPDGQRQASPPVTRPILPHSSRPMPLTLNEISHATSTMPVHLGNPPGAGAVLPPSTAGRVVPSGQQSVPSSTRALHQFLQPPGGMTSPGQVPSTRRLPPITHQHLPSLLVPRGPHHFGPRSFGGHYGGGRGAYGGRGGGGGGRGGGRGR